MTFRDWLQAEATRPTATGDLAADLLRDEAAPLVGATYDKLRWHLQDRAACPEALRALTPLWRRWKGAADE